MILSVYLSILFSLLSLPCGAFRILLLQRRGLTMTAWERTPPVPSSATPSQGDGRIYLIIPFDEKDIAKGMGARWDTETKFWYAMPEDDHILQRWPAVQKLAGNGNAKEIEGGNIQLYTESSAGRAYLSVTYAEKEEAKALGARWDKEAKKWYAPNNEPALLQRWGTESSNPSSSPPASPLPPAMAPSPSGEKGWKVMEGGRSERIYLDVPFEQKDEAKTMGARFCGERKMWYTTDKASPLLQRWNMRDEQRQREAKPNFNHLIPESFEDVEAFTFDENMQ